jgi:hypothetical protein
MPYRKRHGVEAPLLIVAAFAFCLLNACARLCSVSMKESRTPQAWQWESLSACSKQFDAEVEAYSRYLSEGLEGREKVARSLHSSTLDQAVQMILEARSVRKSHISH